MNKSLQNSATVGVVILCLWVFYDAVIGTPNYFRVISSATALVIILAMNTLDLSQTAKAVIGFVAFLLLSLRLAFTCKDCLLWMDWLSVAFLNVATVVVLLAFWRLTARWRVIHILISAIFLIIFVLVRASRSNLAWMVLSVWVLSKNFKFQMLRRWA